MTGAAAWNHLPEPLLLLLLRHLPRLLPCPNAPLPPTLTARCPTPVLPSLGAINAAPPIPFSTHTPGPAPTPQRQVPELGLQLVDGGGQRVAAVHVDDLEGEREGSGNGFLGI